MTRPETANYKNKPNIGDVIEIEEWIECVNEGGFIDYDGWGCPMKEGLVATQTIVRPSNWKTTLPQDATHIEWYNR